VKGAKTDGYGLEQGDVNPIYLKPRIRHHVLFAGCKVSGGVALSIVCSSDFSLDANHLGESAPIASLAFHYNSQCSCQTSRELSISLILPVDSSAPCETARICSAGMKTRVPVSPSNLRRKQHEYENFHGSSGHLEVNH
jgi:hypothetical protein